MPRIAFAGLCVALALLPGCASSGRDAPSPVGATAGVSSTSVDSSLTESSSTDGSSSADSSPPPETSGTEPARPPQEGQPSLQVASLPIGANAGDGCLTIRFLTSASEVPPGMRLVVTRVWFEPEAIEVGGSGCAGEAPSCGGSLNLTESGSDECFAPIRTTDVSTVGAEVKVQVAATVDCPQGQIPACVTFKEKLDSDEQSVGTANIVVPEPPQPETTATPGPSSPAESATPSDSVATAST